MFRIPNFYVSEYKEFDDAKSVIANFGGGDLLDGMEAMNRVLEEHCASGDDDDVFYDNYVYEANAYNKVFSTMQPLFV